LPSKAQQLDAFGALLGLHLRLKFVAQTQAPGLDVKASVSKPSAGLAIAHAAKTPLHCVPFA